MRTSSGLPQRNFFRRKKLAWLLILLALATGETVRADEDSVGVRVPDGFEVTLFADDNLAHDIYSLTIDSFGRVVVSGAGYVKILKDDDNDGVADSAHTFVHGPRSGAQGMAFVGRDLLCAGDAGLIRYRDRNGDDLADGPPDVFLKIRAGNEHDLHAIRKGPDGWWYMIAGNAAGVNEHYASLPTSPVRQPEAGTLLRMKPDLSQGEIFADGFRNAYDFDFNLLGDLFSFDSDGERELSLPWYQPTRVFHVLPGSSMGWVTRGWKHPDSFFDAPPAPAALGRGSPTGVVCYRHDAFPAEYHGALFLLDWTFGRVFALPLKPDGSGWSGKPIEFMSAIGLNGFAPTDAEVAPDGSLYVSVGGRGTRGGVYRIRAKNAPGVAFGRTRPGTQAEKLNVCLRAPQPLSSWSRRVWEPLATELTSAPFIQAALDRSRPVPERVRAIEILTEKFKGIDADLSVTLAGDPSPFIRARAAWSIGRTQGQSPNTRFLAAYLGDRDPIVVRSALEALIGGDESVFDQLVQPVGRQLAHPDRYVRQTAMRVLTRASNATLREMADAGFRVNWRAATPVAAAYALRNPGFVAYTLEVARQTLQGDHDRSLKLEAARLLQLGLGDLTPPEGTLPQVFDGYAAKIDLSPFDRELDPLRVALDQIYPTPYSEVNWELERVIAMVQPPNASLLGKVLSQITEESSPVADIHRLIVASRIPATPSEAQRRIVANAVVQLEPKILSGNYKQDANWDDRVIEMYEALVQRDSHLPVAVLEHPNFGLPGHVQFLAELPPSRFDDAITAFVRQIRANPDYAWNSDVIFLLGQSQNEEEQQMVREKFEDFSMRNAVLMTLAEDPQAGDREYFIEGLTFAPMETLSSCVTSLAMLSPSEDPRENVTLALTLRKLGAETGELEIRDGVAELLRRNLREDHGYLLARPGDPQQNAIAEWIAAIQTRFPEEFTRQSGEDAQLAGELSNLLANVQWEAGDAAKGKVLFDSRSCIQCHNSRKAVGPDLSGVAGRFSREDLFTAIAFPDRDVSPRYQTMQVVTTSGHIHVGMVVYDAIDGLVLQDANNQTFRFAPDEIEMKRRLNKSLMPSGLLKGMASQDLADLYAYLRSLGVSTTAATSSATVPD